MNTDTPDLGPCCVCEATGADVRNIIMIHKKAPIAGRGWGCLQCGLPSNGATVILCDLCLTSYQARGEIILKYACRGYPAADGRIAYSQLSDEPFDHDLTKHPELAMQN